MTPAGLVAVVFRSNIENNHMAVFANGVPTQKEIDVAIHETTKNGKNTPKASDAKYMFLDHIKGVARAVQIGNIAFGHTRMLSKDQKYKEWSDTYNTTQRGTSATYDVEKKSIELHNATVVDTPFSQLYQFRSMDVTYATTSDGLLRAAQLASLNFTTGGRPCVPSQKSLINIEQYLEYGPVVFIEIVDNELNGEYIIPPSSLTAFRQACKKANIKSESVFKTYQWGHKTNSKWHHVMRDYYHPLVKLPDVWKQLVANQEGHAGELNFWNKNTEQIPGKNHKIEQRYCSDLEKYVTLERNTVETRGDHWIFKVMVESRKSKRNHKGFSCGVRRKGTPVMSYNRVPVLHIAFEDETSEFTHLFIALRTLDGGLVINKKNPTATDLCYSLADGLLCINNDLVDAQDYLLFDHLADIGILEKFMKMANDRPPMSTITIEQCFLHFDYIKQEKWTKRSVVGIIDPKTGHKVVVVSKVVVKRKHGQDDEPKP